MKVKEVMKRAVVVENDINLKEAARVMAAKDIGSLVIMSKDKIIGILTDADIMRNIDKLDNKISKIMSKNVITVKENDSLDDAALLMSEKKIKRLPVLRREQLVGIITATDILANSEELNEQFFFDWAKKKILIY